MQDEVIGRVTATERAPSTCTKVRFWVQDDVLIRPFDIVRIANRSKNEEKESWTYAIVQDLSYVTDSASDLASYVSHDFGELDVTPLNKRLGSTIADAQVIFNDQEIEMPIRDGEIVKWADENGVRKALGMDRLKKPIPAGYMVMSNGTHVRVELDAQYLIGPEGAHANISGISGLATKTSYAMFLLNAIHQTIHEEASIVIFNVKGADLLTIDQPLADSQPIYDEWMKVGIVPTPFRKVSYLYPYSNNEARRYTTSRIPLSALEQQIHDNKAWNYYYDAETTARKLSLVFTDVEDATNTMESIISEISRYQEDSPFETWNSFKQWVTEEAKKKSGDITIQSWRKFRRYMNMRVFEHQRGVFADKEYAGVEKRRQVLIAERLKSLKAGEVLVVDIEPLPDYLQCLVVGDVIDTLYSMKLGSVDDVEPETLGKVIVFADELNKYAPSRTGGERTITKNLLEITERGRSLGLVLFGAEQFRSGVHERILGNCSTNIFGRTSPVEIHKCPDYKYLPSSLQSSLTRLPQGQLLLQHSALSTPALRVQFPQPCYVQSKG